MNVLRISICIMLCSLIYSISIVSIYAESDSSTISSSLENAIMSSESVSNSIVDTVEQNIEETTTTTSNEEQSSNFTTETTDDIVTTLSEQAHVSNIGWMVEKSKNDEFIGTTGRNLSIEALKLSIKSNYSGSIKYSAHIRNIGWQKEVENGEVAGTVGKALPIEAIKIYLTGEIANYFDIYYSMHVQNFGWLGWAKNGEMSGSQGYAYHAEAIKLMLVPKGETGPVDYLPAFKKNIHVYYKSHVRNIGWTNTQKDGGISGTTGKALSIEALSFNLSDLEQGSLKYRAHIRNIGWQNWREDNQIIGTTGRALPIEAIQIELTGDLANKYDIYYRTHISNYGWLHWAKNGEISGSTGLSFSVEAVQILLVDKYSNSPGYTARHYINPELLKNDYIIDLSSYQDPQLIDYDLLSRNVQAAIVRVHHGHEMIDKQFAKHITELQKRNVPVAVYAWALGKNDDEMRKDAEVFYSLASTYHPTFWWIDVEQESMSDMRRGVETFRSRLKTLGANKIGVYIANHKYLSFNIDTSKFDGIWIPRYGNNTGFYEGYDPTATNDFDLHQYTSQGKLPGYSSYLDLSRIHRKSFDFFFS